METTKEVIKAFILEEFLQGEDPNALTDSTQLMTGRILDSLATLRLVEFLEKRFQIEVRPEEMTAEYLDTIADMAQLVHSKR